MKNFSLKMMFLFLIALCFSCKSKIIAQEKSKVATDFSAAREKFNPMVYSNNQAAKVEPTISSFTWSTDATYISSDKGCHTVQVRVFITFQGQTRLVASDIVVVSEFKAKSAEIQQQRVDKKDESNCEGLLPDGNFVYRDQGVEIYCLYELLTVNIDIYNSYKKTIAKY
jgi:hypothetical protein